MNTDAVDRMESATHGAKRQDHSTPRPSSGSADADGVPAFSAFVRCRPQNQPRPMRRVILNFWSKITPPNHNGCMLWTGATAGKGYGKIGKHWAHRLAYRISSGFLPDRLHVRHSCDVKLCCNPAHLQLGTASDNNADMVERGRTAKGAKNGMAKLLEWQVREIRASKAEGKTLARILKVSEATISMVRHRKVWNHVK